MRRRQNCVKVTLLCRRSSSVEHELPKLGRRVRFPSLASALRAGNPVKPRDSGLFFVLFFESAGKKKEKMKIAICIMVIAIIIVLSDVIDYLSGGEVRREVER